jgi:hypothetical protein
LKAVGEVQNNRLFTKYLYLLKYLEIFETMEPNAGEGGKLQSAEIKLSETFTDLHCTQAVHTANTAPLLELPRNP